ncbi:amidohydrolase [Bacillus salipaludis]|uniref:amidohydrolase n=1 Tax=Bacillus salipaludis TaxID=2547811 RepID=UPI002E1A4C19|nr:amidohydrolase [Bacillus salipaludis]
MNADLILKGNKVFTGLVDHPEEAAIIIQGNKIIAVCSIEESRFYVGKETKQYEFHNQLILPGFHDAHLHVMLGSLFSSFSVDLSETASEKETAQLVKAFADKRPNDDWIIGNGWDSGNWERKQFPSYSSLDQVIPDRPVLLFHAEGHYAWVNSKALEIAGITSQTENPPYGTILKDEKGEPTGLLIESAVSFIADIALSFSKEKQYELLNGFLQQTKSLGVTSVNDLYAQRALEKLECFDTFKEFDEADRLTTRLHLYPAMNGDLSRVKQMRETFNSQKLRLAGLKQYVDGVVTGYTAYMLDPYVDKPETKGHTAFPPETIKSWVAEADKEGFQIRFHAIGDGAVRLGLDAFEEAQIINGKWDSRHALEHVEVIDPNDIPRFKELGVIASTQPSHLALMPRTSHTSRVKEEKFPYLYTCKSLLDAGAALAFGTDFPIAPLSPILQIFHAVTRVDFTGRDIWNGQEGIRIAEALRAYTMGTAYSVHRETELGTLEPGKLADIVVLDQDLFTVPLKRIPETKVKMTIMDGKIIYTNLIKIYS